MGGKSSRTKGHNYERFVARVLRPMFPDARRGKQYTGGREADVEGTPFRIECKRQKVVKPADIINAAKQGEADAFKWDDDRPVVVITREDRGDSWVTMRLSTAATIVERFFFREPEPCKVIPFPTEVKK